MFVSIQKCLDRKKKPYITLSVEQKQEISQRKAENPPIRKIKIRVQSIEKFSLNINEGEDVFKKSLIFLEHQENVEFKTEDLIVIRRLINQIKLHRLSLLKQPSITITSFLC